MRAANRCLGFRPSLRLGERKMRGAHRANPFQSRKNFSTAARASPSRPESPRFNNSSNCDKLKCFLINNFVRFSSLMTGWPTTRGSHAILFISRNASGTDPVGTSTRASRWFLYASPQSAQSMAAGSAALRLSSASNACQRSTLTRSSNRQLSATGAFDNVCGSALQLQERLDINPHSESTPQPPKSINAHR